MSEGDAVLVIRVLEGDVDAFEELVDHYQKPVFNVAFRIVQDYDDARDITQNVFIKAFEGLEQFDTSRKFFSWIYRIAVNESLNLLNRRKRFEPADEQMDATVTTPEQTLDQVELSDSITDALRALKPAHRTVIVLRHFLGCTYRDIGAMLELPEKTVKSRLFTARQRLKDILERRGIKQIWSRNA